MQSLSKLRLAGWVGALCAITALPASGADPLSGKPPAPSSSTNAGPVAVQKSDPAVIVAPAGVYASPWVAEVAKLAQAGVEEEVLFAYVANTEGTFNLDASQMAALGNLGVSGEVFNAMVQHDLEVANGTRILKATTVPVDSKVTAAIRSVAMPKAEPTATHNENESIIVRDDPPEAGADALSSEFEPSHTSKCAGKLYRVRKPYPVRLTDTIVVFRSEPRVSNMQIMHPLGP